MDCPYCGKEMKAGGIPAGRCAVYWQENSEEIDAPQEKVILSKNPVWRIEQAEAFYCPRLPPDYCPCAGDRDHRTEAEKEAGSDQV